MAAAMASGRLIFDADHVEGLVDVDGHLGAICLLHVRFVRGVAVCIGFNTDDSRVAADLGKCGRFDLVQRGPGQQRFVRALAAAAAAAMTSGRLIFDADHVEGLVDVDGHLGAICLLHVRFVRGVAVCIGFNTDDSRVAADLGKCGRFDLVQRGPGQQRFVRALSRFGCVVGDCCVGGCCGAGDRSRRVGCRRGRGG